MRLQSPRIPILAAALAAVCAGRYALAQQVDRTVLPIPEPQPPAITELSARDAKPPARFDVKAPQGAPNVVIVLLDDIGFGQSSAFGGPIKMPTLDKLAAGGLRYNNFHTTALCSPDAHGAADGPQPPRQQRRRDHGARDGISRATPASVRRASRRSPRCCG